MSLPPARPSGSWSRSASTSASRRGSTREPDFENIMTTGTRRDPRADHLITPENAALIVIDYQPSQVAAVRSMESILLLKNVVSTAKIAKAFGLTISNSPVNVACGGEKLTVHAIPASVVEVSHYART